MIALGNRQEVGVDIVEESADIEPCCVGHHNRADSLLRVHTHHAVKPSATALFEEEAGATRRADVPPQRHRNGRPLIRMLLLKKKTARMGVEQARLPLQLILDER